MKLSLAPLLHFAALLFGQVLLPLRLGLASKQNRAIAVLRANGRFGGHEIGFVNVTGYRLYGLDGVNKVASGEWFEADDDETAIEVAKDMMDGHDCELWSRSRLVARIPRRHKR